MVGVMPVITGFGGVSHAVVLAAMAALSGLASLVANALAGISAFAASSSAARSGILAATLGDVWRAQSPAGMALSVLVLAFLFCMSMVWLAWVTTTRALDDVAKDRGI
jgi:hypothetical protein